MTYPATIPDWIKAAREYVPPAELAEQYYVAAYQPSPAAAIVDVFAMLRDRDDLGADGLAVLIGAADIIRQPGHGYQGMSASAATVLAQRAGELSNEPADA